VLGHVVTIYFQVNKKICREHLDKMMKRNVKIAEFYRLSSNSANKKATSQIEKLQYQNLQDAHAIEKKSLPTPLQYQKAD